MLSIRLSVVSLAMLYLMACGSTTPDPADLTPPISCGSGTHLDADTATCQGDVPELLPITSAPEELIDEVPGDDDSVTEDDAEVTEVDAEDDLSLSAAWRTDDSVALSDGTPVRVRTVLDGYYPVDLPAFIVGSHSNPITGDVSDPYLLLETDSADERWNMTRGPAAGMSGSPIIIDGRNAGGLSFSVGDTDCPCVFVATPIEGMDRLLEYADAIPYEPSFAPMTVVMSSVGMAEYGEGLFDMFDEDYVIVQNDLATSAGAVGEAGEIPVLEPGSAIAVALITGDVVNLEGIGTVTAIDGNRVLAFGHPMAGAGYAQFPFRAAYVETVVSNPTFGAYKIGAGVGPILGTITQDRFSGIAGEFGLMPDTIAVTTNIARDGGVVSRVHEVTRNERITFYEAYYTAYAAALPVSAQRGFSGPGSTFFTVTTTIKGVEEPLMYSSVASNSFDPIGEMFYRMVFALLPLIENNYVPVQLASMDLDVEVSDTRHEYSVLEISSGDEVQTDADLLVSVTLQAYREEVSPRALTLHIPADFPAGEARLNVGAADSFSPEGVSIYDAETIEELVAAYNNLPQANQLMAQLTSMSWTPPQDCKPIVCPEDVETTEGEAVEGDVPEEIVVCEKCVAKTDANGDPLLRPSVSVILTERAVILGSKSKTVNILPLE